MYHNLIHMNVAYPGAVGAADIWYLMAHRAALKSNQSDGSFEHWLNNFLIQISARLMTQIKRSPMSIEQITIWLQGILLKQNDYQQQ